MIDLAPTESTLSEGETSENASKDHAAGVSIVEPRASRRRLSDPGSRKAWKASPLSYAAYIKSDAWRFSPARLAELLASGGRCRICNDGGQATILHVHHRTYERLGYEVADDLTTLCEACHDVVTVMQRGRAITHRPFPDPLDLPKADGHRTLVDSREEGR